MSLPFLMRLPVEPELRVLAGQVAGRYAEACGGDAAKVSAFSSDVQRAVDAAGAAETSIAFDHTAGAVTATVTSAGGARQVRVGLSS